MSARPVIALLTDFGTRDHYVGAMKAVVAGICPDAHIIDITHEIPPQDIRSAAFTLAAAWREFPPSSVFVVVVDPGVGTSRPAIAARVGDRYVVGPDNGVFDLVLTDHALVAAVHLENAAYARPVVAPTFEGRDRFAPAAAWLATGVTLDAFGAAVSLSARMPWAEPRVLADRVVGHVIHVDRFGNLVTNVRADPWATVVSNAEVWLSGHGPVPVVRTYGDARPGTMVSLFGSTSHLEVAVVGGNAAQFAGIGVDAEVHVVWRA